MPSYYDIDTILAEEELLVVRPSFSFAHLAHLDPDANRLQQVNPLSRKRRRDDDAKENIDSNSNHNSDGLSKSKSRGSNANHFLAEGTKIKLPLWAVDRWAMLGFVKIPTLPRHYGRRMKERLEADSVAVDLRSKNEYYFLTGILLTNLLTRAAHIAKLHSSNNSSRRSNSALNTPTAQTLAMQHLLNSAQSLQHSLLNTMLGDRLCRNFDWTLSALDTMEDDVSSHVQKLSMLERYMFEKGVEASGAVSSWREFGCGRLGVSLAVMKGRSMGRGRPQAMQTVQAEKRDTRSANVVTPVGAGAGGNR